MNELQFRNACAVHMLLCLCCTLALYTDVLEEPKPKLLALAEVARGQQPHHNLHCKKQLQQGSKALRVAPPPEHTSIKLPGR